MPVPLGPPLYVTSDAGLSLPFGRSLFGCLMIFFPPTKVHSLPVSGLYGLASLHDFVVLAENFLTSNKALSIKEAFQVGLNLMNRHMSMYPFNVQRFHEAC